MRAIGDDSQWLAFFVGCGMPEQGEMRLHYDQPAEYFYEL
jgi:hypothetical protein